MTEGEVLSEEAFSYQLGYLADNLHLLKGEEVHLLKILDLIGEVGTTSTAEKLEKYEMFAYKS